MPVLNNIREETVCKENRELLGELINEEGFIDLSSLELGQQEEIINKIIKNEESNVKASEENYEALKYKARNISELLVLALALLVAGLTLAPLFIASSIILPVLPVLFFGVAIIAITKLVLNMKIKQLGINVINAKEVCQLIKPEIDKEIREIKSTIMTMGQMDEQPAKTNHSSSELLTNRGTFSIQPISDDEDPVNILHRENIPSYSHS